MLNDDKLKAIAITTEDNEVLAVIPNDGTSEIIQKNGVLVRFNYSDKEYKFEDKDGKVYIKE